MMYNNKLAAAIRVNGKVLREHKDTVYLPYGSEYQVRLKNLNTVRALIHIFIDGEDTTPGGLVLNVGQEVDFERSLANGSLVEGNKFRFIERTKKIEDHRGIRVEDGLIRIEFQFEKKWIPPLYPTTIKPTYPNQLWNQPWNTGSPPSNGIYCSGLSDVLRSYNVASADAGITVPGSKSEQKFTTVSSFNCESEKHNLVIKLLGETEENKVIREPVTVKSKPKCDTCGKVNKATSKFCSECGTSLVIFAGHSPINSL